jgi:hypothetical protein
MRGDKRAENRSVESDDKRLGVAIFVVFAACLATAIAYVADAIGSTDEAGSHQTPLLVTQLIIAVVGLIPAGLFARALVRRKDLQAVVWLVIGTLVYLGWGLFNDAAVHGWEHLKIF